MWSKISAATVVGRVINNFDGLIMQCRTCDFEITRIGTVSKEAV